MLTPRRERTNDAAVYTNHFIPTKFQQLTSHIIFCPSDEKLDIHSQVRDSLEDMKRVKVNPPKNGCLYPALSDIEASSNTNSDQYFSTEERPTKVKNVRFENNVQPSYSSQDEDDDDERYTFNVSVW